MTAGFVAVARAVASGRPMTSPALDDALAPRLIPRVLRPFVPRGAVGQVVARGAMGGLVDHIALRTAAIDDVLADPFPQVVLLGAGFDARAYRLPSLAGAHVFEVDHPASQAAKRAAVRGIDPRCRKLDYIAADFAKDDIDGLLAAAGHDEARPTAWILEGVTMYLPAAMTTRLLEVVGRRSAPTSRLAATYARPPEGALATAMRHAAQLSLARIGEPWVSTYATETFHAQLRAVGLGPRSDTCSVEWAARFGASALLAFPLRAERLVVAVR